MAVDKVKVQKKSIIESAIAAFNDNRDDKKYSFEKAAHTMVEEAYNLGKLVGSGKAHTEEEAAK